MPTVVLETKNISKVFGSAYANEDISISLEEGQVLALLGENGAGKSTLMNILYGVYKASSGEIYIRGKKANITSPEVAVELGIGMVHQEFMLIDSMTVFENIILGTNKDHRPFIDEANLGKEILELSDHYGMQIDLDEKIQDISIGSQQRVEILKALYRGADVLLLDEPTSVLTEEETKGLFDTIRKLVAEGKSIIFVTHKLREVMAVSDVITILRSGKSVKTLETSGASEQEIANIMTGRQISSSEFLKQKNIGSTVMEVKGVSYNKYHKHDGLTEIDIKVHAGEILGIAGVDGNGQSQLAELLAGNLKPEEGTMLYKGTQIKKFSSKAFHNMKISYVPEDRIRMGLIGEMSICDNIVLKETSSRDFSYGRGWLLKKKKLANYTSTISAKYDIRYLNIEQFVKDLSGGNQQKIILARELEVSPDLLIVAHPTRGLDIGAATFVHELMIAARDRGCAIILISADMEEVLSLSDYIHVMYEGRLSAAYDGAAPPLEKISLAMAGKAS